MKARYKIKTATGRKARELDERQAEVIRNLLHRGAPVPGAAAQDVKETA